MIAARSQSQGPSHVGRYIIDVLIDVFNQRSMINSIDAFGGKMAVSFPESAHVASKCITADAINYTRLH